MSAAKKKILVVNMNYLGDALMMTPAHAALRKKYPEAQIDTIAGARAGYGAFDILANNPDIDRVIPRAAGGAVKRCWQLWSTLVAGRYDTVIVLPPIPAYQITAMLAFTPHRILARRCDPGEHMADVMLEAVSPEPAGGDLRHLVLRLAAADIVRAKALLDSVGQRRPLIGVNLGASRPQKRWPTAAFASLVSALVSSGHAIALLGGGGAADLSAASDIVTHCGSADVLNLVGKTTIGELCAVVAQCDAIVTADTGAMHIAVALEVPVVALFGSTSPEKVGPYGNAPSRVLYKRLPCSPCENHPTCGGAFTCMSEIASAEVLDAVQQLLAAEKRPVAAKAG